MASRSPRRKSPRRKASPRKRRASPKYWDDCDEENVAVPFPVYIYRPSVPFVAPIVPQPELSPKVKELKNKLQLLLKEHLEQQLAPKQDKDLLIDLQLRLLHLMQQPIQNQYEIKLIQVQLDQQLKKKLSPKENTERYRQIQLLLEEIDEAQKQAGAPKPPVVASSSEQTRILQDIQKQLDALKKAVAPAAAIAAAPAPAPIPAPSPAPIPAAAPANPVKDEPDIVPPPAPGAAPIKKEKEAKQKDYISAIKQTDPGSNLKAYKHYREVYNDDGNGFFRAVGFEILHGLDKYDYKKLAAYIDSVKEQFKDETFVCVNNFYIQIKEMSDGEPGGYITKSPPFDKQVVCTVKSITLAYITQHPDYIALKPYIQEAKVDLAVMDIVCKALKINMSLISVGENNSVITTSIKGDASRQDVDGYINRQFALGSTEKAYLYLMYKK